MQSKWKRVGQRVNAAKRWLAKAEEEFSKERPMRGELNLMLAEAELKRLKESEPTRQRFWMRHGAAFGAAAVIVCAVSGAWLLMPRAVVVPATVPAVVSEPVKAIAPVKLPDSVSSTVSAAAPLQHTPVVAEVTAPSARLEQQDIVDNRQQEKAFTRERPNVSVGVSDAEMRQLVRKAGQTLRGQQ